MTIHEKLKLHAARNYLERAEIVLRHVGNVQADDIKAEREQLEAQIREAA